MAFGAALLTPRMKADGWDKLTKVTLSAPLEIPGQVLAPGTYWFKLLDSPSDRNIVQIYNADQSKQIAMIMAIPDYRLKPTDKTVITFEERSANSPEAIKAWFYPGDNYGQEFVYPKPRAVALAKVVKQPVLSMPANLESSTKVVVKSAKEAAAVALKKAPVKAQQPTGEEVEITGIVQTPPPLVAQNTPPPARPTPAPAPAKPAELPSTASDLPLLGLAGCTLLGAGFLIRLAGKKLS
jgi:hypothetical protein